MQQGPASWSAPHICCARGHGPWYSAKPLHQVSACATDTELRTCTPCSLQVRGEVEALRGAAAGGSVAASEDRIRELAARLDSTKLCAACPRLLCQTCVARVLSAT